MLISTAPTDPADQFAQRLAAYERRIADLERAMRRDVGSLPMFASRYAPLELAWTSWLGANGHTTDASAAVQSTALGNWGTPNNDGKVALSGKRCRASLDLIAGAAAGQNPGNLVLSLPVAGRFNAAVLHTVGHGFYMNAATSIFAPFEIVQLSATTALLRYAATHLGTYSPITAAAPFAFGVGVFMSLNLDYERA